jgi:hypothetical protein
MVPTTCRREAECRFPHRVDVSVPGSGLGQRVSDIDAIQFAKIARAFERMPNPIRYLPMKGEVSARKNGRPSAITVARTMASVLR